MNPEEIVETAEVQVVNRELYNPANRQPVNYGCLDRRLGTSDKQAICETCGGKLADCVGHFGHIQLALPVWHIGFFRAAMQLLQDLCKACGSVLMAPSERQIFLKRLRAPRLDSLAKAAIVKGVRDRCRRTPKCPNCGAMNGVIKRYGVMKLVHEPPRNSKSTAASANDPKGQVALQQRYAQALEGLPELKPHLSKIHDDISPIRAQELFSRLTADDCELLGMDSEHGHPRNFLWTQIPVPPACIRPSVAMAQEGGSNEDDLTVKLSEIVYTNSIIADAIAKGSTPNMVMCAMYINSELPGVPLALQTGKPIRGICQRLKGKMGRFRGNLSGKRVDFSSRTVISPDPNLRIDQIGVPVYVAKTLTYPEVVTRFNLERLRQAVINGPDVHPGANFVIQQQQQQQQQQTPSILGQEPIKRYLKFGDRAKLARELRPGDVVERHLIDGDICLFNRQPSLHKLSIMCHEAVVRPWRTFRFNECACTPYNADFDGDEMNLHLPQTEEARAEARELMAVRHNLVTPRNGQPLISAMQDFITASHLISSRDVFYTRAQLAQVCLAMVGADEAGLHFDLPPPTIWRPMALWSGKQVISLLLRPNRQSPIRLCVEAKGRTWIPKTDPPECCPVDGYLVIRDGELLLGRLDKSSVGGDSKHSLFYCLLRDYGPDAAVRCMSRLARLCARWLGNRGFSIGIDDVTPGPRLSAHKQVVVEQGYAECDRLIEQYRQGDLPSQPGCTPEQSLEASLSGILSRLRDDCGQLCLQELHRHNAPLLMQWCGSKGSKINVSQMVACVGQQIIGGQRIPDGFEGRSLPHFPKHSRIPAAKGFVRNSFYTGLTPTEFFFHAVSGREGLVDTAVKTAETGYMQRRLMKALEDLSVQYDLSVRDAIGGVVQFCYGDDGLDPAAMEGESVPVNLARTWSHAQATFEDTLMPVDNVSLFIEELLAQAEWAECSETFVQTVRTFLQRLQALDTKPSGFFAPLSPSLIKAFLDACLLKYRRARMEPGTAVGALGAQSIGEPGTQMTLKTFHFAGVASMNVTLGVPRIKEIINASKFISTPIITAPLINDRSLPAARMVKGRVETTRLGDVCRLIETVYRPQTGPCLQVEIDTAAIEALQLELDADGIRQALINHAKLKLKPELVRVLGKNRLLINLPVGGYRQTGRGTGAQPIASVSSEVCTSAYLSLQQLKRQLPSVIVKGIPSVGRAVINDLGGKQYNLLVEGYGLRHVMATEGIRGTHCHSNHIIEMQQVLGIEAARSTILSEILYTMSKHGMTIDPRHVQLLADCMTSRGEVLGITRFGIGRMKDSVLMLASFERTVDHLFEAARASKRDGIEGVSECIIMGRPMPIGTGLFKLVQRVVKRGEMHRKEPLFDQPTWHPQFK